MKPVFATGGQVLSRMGKDDFNEICQDGVLPDAIVSELEFHKTLAALSRSPAIFPGQAFHKLARKDAHDLCQVTSGTNRMGLAAASQSSLLSP